MASGVAYGTAELADLCGFATPASGAGRLKAISLALARHPRRARTLLSLRELPVLELRLSAAEHDRWLHARWPTGGEPLFGGHWAQAVIPTALDEHKYLTGRHRQAVRTNIHRARELGIAATVLGGYDEFVAASTPVYRSRPGGEAVLASMRPPPPNQFAWYSASTPAEEAPVVVAAVALFGYFGVLAVMVGNRRNAHVGYARHLLHTFLLRDLAARGVRHLIVGSVLRESSGNRYFQRLLGYRVCNLRPILPTTFGDRGGVAATARRLLMVGPTVENAQPAREDSQRITSPASARAGHAERVVVGGDDDPGSEVGVTSGREHWRSTL